MAESGEPGSHRAAAQLIKQELRSLRYPDLNVSWDLRLRISGRRRGRRSYGLFNRRRTTFASNGSRIRAPKKLGRSFVRFVIPSRIFIDQKEFKDV